MDLKKIKVSDDNTYHLIDEKQLYSKRFKHVLKFHSPGLAPVLDETGAYHIKTNGSPAYSQRFIKTFGFYFEKAAVITDKGWGHINIDGSFVYQPIFGWVGNYQDSICTVRDKNGNYFHIDIKGKRIYAEDMLYAGDFRDGISVVRKNNGLCVHMNKRGELIHSKQFLDLDVFHKDFARARDENGWFHIDKKGEEIYSYRFSSVEPFYNGFAFVEDFDGRRLIIDEKGKIVHEVLKQILEREILDSNKHLAKFDFSLFNELSASLVSFWGSQTIYAGVKLGIFENINKEGTILEDLANKIEIDFDNLKKIVRGLSSLNLLVVEDNKVFITQKGKFLQEDSEYSLATAARMWNEEHYDTWKKAFDSLKSGSEQFSSLFKKTFFEWLHESESKTELYQKAISTYAKKDYYKVPLIHDFSKHKLILDVGGGSGYLIKYLLEKYPTLKGMILESEKTIKITREEVLKDFTDRCDFIIGNFFEEIPKNADAIFLCRILHDWNDEYASKILKNCFNAMEKNDKLYIIELILPENLNKPLGALLNLNMLILTGGKERTKTEFVQLLERSGFYIEQTKEIDAINSLIIATKERV